MKYLAVLLLSVLFIFTVPKPDARADHGVALCGGDGLKACLATVSPFTKQQIINQGYFTWCLNPRASNYPDFRASVQNVMYEEAVRLGVDNWEVGYGNGCTVKNDMRLDHPCGNCGAWVYTQNFPVLIEYNEKQSYYYWDSVIGHELFHAVCLEDEHYDKIGFRSFILTFGFWQHGEPTVMDSGTPYLPEYRPRGIYWPTAYDLNRCRETLAPPGVQSFYGTWYEPDGRVFGYFCDTDDFRATRVAIMTVAPDGTPYWSGIHMSPSNGCRSFEILPGPGWCFEVNVENAFSWKKYRNDVRLGCT